MDVLLTAGDSRKKLFQAIHKKYNQNYTRNKTEIYLYLQERLQYLLEIFISLSDKVFLIVVQ